jgi:hypothetical protein
MRCRCPPRTAHGVHWLRDGGSGRAAQLEGPVGPAELDRSAMAMIVLVTLAVDAETGAIDPSAPFVVSAPPPHRRAVYENEPAVIAQFLPGEEQARFEVEWSDGEWKFGKRVVDA